MKPHISLPHLSILNFILSPGFTSSHTSASAGWDTNQGMCWSNEMFRHPFPRSALLRLVTWNTMMCRTPRLRARTSSASSHASCRLK